MAPELGQLLLGPGHRWNSIMRDRWRIELLSGFRQQWQSFSDTEHARIERKL